MSNRPRRVVLLGSRHDEDRAHPTLADLGAPGPVAAVTAGLQEWEDDDTHLDDPLVSGAVNLALYQRAERVWAADPELAAAHRELGHRVRTLRRAYNVRLAPAMDAWIHLEAMAGDDDVLAAERANALEAVQALDRHQLDRLVNLREDYLHRLRPWERDAVVREREQVAGILRDVATVVVEGGHVPVLLNRLRLFGVIDFLGDKTVVARSGGAMALGTRVVLFHDTPPWGPGHAEIGERGLGLYDGVVAFPLVSRRLRLDDPGRVSRLARRFTPDACVLLEADARVTVEDGRWRVDGARHLDASGSAEPWRPAA